MLRVLCCLAFAILPAVAAAQPVPPAERTGEAEEIVYPASFFARYHPVTALDMVRRVPGFRLDEGSGRRGFAEAAGNVLINGERPSTKSDSLSDILARIPAERVEKIVLIRGNTAGYDLPGQDVIVDVRLKTAAEAVHRWRIDVEQDVDGGPVTPTGFLSRSATGAGLSYDLGATVRRFAINATSLERLLLGEARGPAELRDEDLVIDGVELELAGNAEIRRGAHLVHVNGKINFEHRSDRELSRRDALDPLADDRLVTEGGERDELRFELGADWSRSFGPFSAKVIGLGRRTEFDRLSSRDDRLLDGAPLILRRADTDSVETEIIGRIELDWAGVEEHLFELDAEGALNRLSNVLLFTVDTGAGPEIVPVPGADTLVRERRGDFGLKDTWSRGPWVVEARLGAEVSTIIQTGDARNRRSFFFMKPRFMTAWAPNPRRNIRLNIRRDVAQLDFFDFVSATNFADEQLALGNPELKPERTWILEASLEQRFGEIGVVTLTPFYHRIEDVQDLLPLRDDLEVPGNIGSGKRFGIRWEMTLPLAEWIGLAGARLDVEGSAQRSRVRDPVTGRPRPLSFERKVENDIQFRQDFRHARLAWGFEILQRAPLPFFGIDERVLDDPGVSLDVFVETTRFFGFKIRIRAENLINDPSARDRAVFTGLRALTPLDFIEARRRRIGRSLILTAEGSF